MKMISVSYDDILDALEILEDECIQIQRDGRHWRISDNAPVERRRVQHYDRRGMPVDNGSGEVAYAVEISTIGDEFVSAHVMGDSWGY